MRKRTYTALEGTDCVLGSDICSADYVSVLQNNAAATSVAVATTQGGSLSRTHEHSKIHTHSATSHRGAAGAILVDSPPPPTAEETVSPAPPDTNETPLTTIHNLVGTCEIASSVTPIDLEYVFKSLPNSFYDRKRFAAITIRVTEPVCTGLLFTSGKLVITGCKSLVECTLASLKIVRMLQRHLPTVTFLVRNAVVQNVVAHVVLPMQPGQRLNVDRLYEDFCCNCTFQPTMFPVRTVCFGLKCTLQTPPHSMNYVVGNERCCLLCRV